LGYDLVIGSATKKRGAHGDEDPSARYAWAGVSGNELERCSGIRKVDGVALLCYSKQL